MWTATADTQDTAAEPSPARTAPRWTVPRLCGPLCGKEHSGCRSGDKCEIQLSYAIGVARPTSIMVDTFGTGKLSDEKLTEIVRTHFDLRPAGIIRMLDLRRPIYKQTAAYGHFGRNDLDLPWEKLDKVEELKKYL